MRSYWLSWHVLSNGSKDGINSYVFPLAIRLVRRDRLAFVPIYLGSLFIVLMSAYTTYQGPWVGFRVVSFMLLFLWGKSKTLKLKPAECEIVEMVDVENENGNVLSA